MNKWKLQNEKQTNEIRRTEWTNEIYKKNKQIKKWKNKKTDRTNKQKIHRRKMKESEWTNESYKMKNKPIK